MRILPYLSWPWCLHQYLLFSWQCFPGRWIYRRLRFVVHPGGLLLSVLWWLSLSLFSRRWSPGRCSLWWCGDSLSSPVCAEGSGPASWCHLRNPGLPACAWVSTRSRAVGSWLSSSPSQLQGRRWAATPNIPDGLRCWLWRARIRSCCGWRGLIQFLNDLDHLEWNVVVSQYSPCHFPFYRVECFTEVNEADTERRLSLQGLLNDDP